MIIWLILALLFAGMEAPAFWKGWRLLEFIARWLSSRVSSSDWPWARVYGEAPCGSG